ncbi:ASN_collapsed_G0034890.mRNA.1.CDS.1 [Saccharomyces cerevisiae]|nr:ASN_collapsed_G0034890.mRNA.1.CDS.1 [Saccharomyces cerevisiae]
MSKVDVKIGADSISSSDEILVPSRLADVTLAFMEENDAAVPEITPEQEKKLKRKLFLTIFTFVSAINLLLYMDKATLSYDSILGFFEDTGLTQNTYNTVNTLFTLVLQSANFLDNTWLKSYHLGNSWVGCWPHGLYLFS